MSITAKPRPESRQRLEKAFMEGAPDAQRTAWKRGRKTQITLSLPPELLEEVDKASRRSYQSRAAWIIMTIIEHFGKQS